MLIVGHRGAAGLKPENTMAGFTLALELGVDWLECDLRLTKDGHVVLMHDATVDRTTNGTGAVHDMTWDDIAPLDAGDGETVPTFQQYLQLLNASSAMSEIEIKAPEALLPALDILTDMNMLDRISITAKLDVLAVAKKRIPTVRIGLPSANPSTEDVERMAALGGSAVGIRYPHLTADIVAKCHELGMEARGWNPITKETIAHTMSFGVDSVTTDRPDIALTVRRELGLDPRK